MPQQKKSSQNNKDVIPPQQGESEFDKLKQSIETETDSEKLDQLLKTVEASQLDTTAKHELKKLGAAKIKEIKKETQNATEELKHMINDSNDSIPATAESIPTTSENITDISSNSNPSGIPNQNQKPEETGFFGKTGAWIGEQWHDMFDKEKWRTETGKNALRVAGFLGTGIGVLKGLWKIGKWGVRKIKGLFSSKEETIERKHEELEELYSIHKDKRTERQRKRITELIEEIAELEKEKRNDAVEHRGHSDDKEEKSWWKKFLIGAGIATGTVIGGVSIYKHWNKISSRVKEKLGLSLTFDEARQKVESEVHNGKVDDDHFGVFNAHFEGGIIFDEQTQEICSYGQKTKIDKNSKKLQGMDVEFPSWEELIHAANIVNFAKRMLKGRGENSTPFCQTKWGGDIAFNCSATGKQAFLSANNSNEWSWILGTVGTVGGGLLGGYCAGVQGAAIGAVGGGLGGYALGAYRDNNSSAGRCCATIAKGANFDRFINYLNGQTDEKGESLWEAVGEQRVDSNGSPINGLVDNGEDGTDWNGVLAEIENSFGNDQSGRRILNIEWNETNPEEYKIQSYNHELKLTLKGGPKKKGETIDYRKIESIHIEKYDKYQSRGDGLDIDFPHTEDGLKEAIRVANLTNMIVEDWKGKGGEAYPFAYGRYKMPYNLDIDTDGNLGSTVLSHSKLEQRFPTILNDLGEYPSFSGFFGIQDKMHDQAVHDKREGSQYIKFLHQIGKGNFWKSS